MDRSALIRQPNLNVDSEAEKLIRHALGRLMRHEPIQYVLAEAPFMGMMLEVGPDVLIPRPETEELVQMIIRETRHTRIRILDIGTGSGCIAIALKKALPQAELTAIDFSEEALHIATRNAQKQGVSIKFKLSDILKEELWNEYEDFDIVVSNPPYISMQEKDQLEKHVRDFEPSMALFAPEEDPLIFYRKISSFCRIKLFEWGALYIEINNRFANETAIILEGEGFKAEIIKDMFGNPRFIKAIRYR